MIDNRIKCNFCGVQGCNNYDNLNFSKGCRLFIEMNEMKTPLLVHLLSNKRKISNTKEVLEKFGFSIQETYVYPYFKLVEV